MSDSGNAQSRRRACPRSSGVTNLSVARVSGGKPPFPTQRLSTSRLAHCLEGFPRSLDRLIDDQVSMGGAHEAGFELRWSQVDTLIKHGVKKPAVECPVTLVGRIPIRDWLICKEAGPHR